MDIDSKCRYGVHIKYTAVRANSGYLFQKSIINLYLSHKYTILQMMHVSGHKTQKTFMDGETPEVDVNLALLKLEQYVNALVDNICTDALAYNTFIAKNMPYGLRDGRIKRSILNSILPEMSMFKDRDKALDVLSRQESSPVWHTERMTLRTYMHVWRIAYDAYRRKGSALCWITA